jgi:ABC-type transport system substrate-binding protein
MPNGKVAPNLARQGIRGYRFIEPAHNYLLFNMEDAMVGGYQPHHIALRRAISLGMDTRAEIAYAYNGQATPSQSPYWPETSGYSPDFKSEFSDYDPARAKALLDVYGYADRDGDGWREKPDGSPLVLRMSAQTDQRTRKINEIFGKNMTALGLRCEFVIAQWPENLKSARAGKLAMWSVGAYAAGPDGGDSLTAYHSAQIGGQNFARFKLPAFDALFEKTLVLPDGPEREALFQQATRLAIAYMPYKFKLDRISTDMTQPWLVGYRRPVFWQEFWQYVDIDDSRRPEARR